MNNYNEKYFYPDDNETKPSIETILNKDEEIIEHLTPDKKAYFWSQLLFNISTILIWLIVDSLFIFLIIKAKVYETKPAIFLFVMCFLALHLYPVWNWIYRVIKTALNLSHEEYFVTNQRIIRQTGIQKIKFTAVQLEDIYEINVKINFIDKQLKVGDLNIKFHKSITNAECVEISSVTQSIVLFDLKEPKNIVQLIQQLKANTQKNTERGKFDENN